MSKLTIDEAQRMQDESEAISCPMCDGNDSQVLGVLGVRVYFTCRACGWQFSRVPNMGK